MKLQTLPWTRCEALWVWFTSVDTFARFHNSAASDASTCARNDAAHAVELELTVERMSYGADAIAHTADGKTVFVSSGAVPGDTVRARLTDDDYPHGALHAHSRDALQSLRASRELAQSSCLRLR